MTKEALRKQAVARLKSSTRLRKCAPPATKRRLLARELAIHQMERELLVEELRRAHGEIDAAHQRYDELYEQVPVAYTTLDENGRIVEANPGAAMLLGIERSLLQSKPLAAFMRSTDAEGFHAFRRNAIATQRQGTLEIVLRCAGAVFRPVHVVVSPSSTGEAALCRCALLDVSHVRAAEEALRAAESNAQAVLDAAPDAIVTLDHRGRIVSLNAATERTFGPVSGQRLETLMPSPWRETYAPHIHHLATTGAHELVGGAPRCVRGLRRDGSTFPMELEVTERRARGERMFTGVLRDVSDREDALARLREAKERFDLITEHIEDVFYIAEADGAVTYVSHAFERIWGRSADELLGRSDAWLDDVAEEDKPEVETALASLGRGNPLDVEYRIRSRDGTTRWIHDRAFPIEDQDGRVVRYVGVARDQTSEHALALELAHVQKMETIGTLSSGIAHDINNVLQVVVGATALAADETIPPEQAHQFLRRAREVAMRGAELVHRITGFARKELLHRRPISVDDTLREAELMLVPLLGEHIELVVRPAATNAHVRATQVQLEQILLNLASNARDAMPTGGVFTLRTAVVPRMEGGSPRVQILVDDTGCGMSEATKARIFDPFFTTKGPGRGTGLGLATVLAVVEQLGGSLAVESEPGNGTTIAITLPTCEPEQTALTTIADHHFEGTALLVEDEPLVRRSVRRQLEQLGLQVLEAEGGERALQIARDRGHPPEVVVSDVLMPEMTGPQVVKQLRDTWPSLPVLYVSGHPGDALETSTLDARTRLLPKPFEQGDLVSELEQLMACPIGAASADAPSSEGSTAASERHATLLLVEDEEISRRGMQRLLADSGLLVLAAANVGEARELASSRTIDVLVTDLHLPDGTGDTLAEEITRMQPGASVIYMSGAPPAGLRVQAPYVEKPLDIDDLLQLVDRLLQERAPVRHG